MSLILDCGGRGSSAAVQDPCGGCVAADPGTEGSSGPLGGSCSGGGAVATGRPVPPSGADFRTLYDAHFRLVWATLTRLGVRDEDLMDLTQKVFLTAYLKLPEFEGRSLFSTWLWSISRRVAIAHRRSAPMCREVATDPSVFEVLLVDATNVTTSGESAQQAQAILSKLTDGQRVVFLLFEVDRLSGREIATLLGIPLGTVRSRMRYAREVFRREAERLKRSEKAPRRQWSKQQSRMHENDQANVF